MASLKLCTRLSVGPEDPYKARCILRHHPTARWDRYYRLSQNQQSSLRPIPERPNREPRERFWACDDSGLLIYLHSTHELFSLCDLNFPENSHSLVPFRCQGRIVRRIRLRAELLIIEWAEEEPYHQLNDMETVHRHFVTAFDVKPPPLNGLDTPKTAPRAEFRNEWKLHFLGFPLKSQDLWLSAHTNTHYAAYIWQPNRSAWGEDEPIESLSVWDISQRSDYRPSMDPSGGSIPENGPQIVNKISYKALGHLTIRQRDAPVLRKLELDAGMVSNSSPLAKPRFLLSFFVRISLLQT